MILTQHDDFWPDDTMGLKNRYSLVWPTERALTPEAEQELLLRCFGDSTASSFEQATTEGRNCFSISLPFQFRITIATFFIRAYLIIYYMIVQFSA